MALQFPIGTPVFRLVHPEPIEDDLSEQQLDYEDVLAHHLMRAIYPLERDWRDLTDGEKDVLRRQARVAWRGLHAAARVAAEQKAARLIRSVLLSHGFDPAQAEELGKAFVQMTRNALEGALIGDGRPVREQ